MAHKIDGPGSTIDNRFTEGAPFPYVAPTTVTAAWGNMVQEEILNVLAAAGIAPDKENNAQLVAAIDALIAEAFAAVGTPLQFDNGTSLATTEFVQRALGNMRGHIELTADTTLDASHAGKAVYVNKATPCAITLPGAAALPAGSAFSIMNTGAGDVTVSRAGTDQIVAGPAASPVNSITLKAGDSISLVSLGTGTNWRAMGGAAQLRYAGAFGASIAAAGYQKLPSGLILQWGIATMAQANTMTTVTLPISFPNGCFLLLTSKNNNGPTFYGTWGYVVSASQISVAAEHPSAVFWLAFGY